MPAKIAQTIDDETVDLDALTGIVADSTDKEIAAEIDKVIPEQVEKDVETALKVNPPGDIELDDLPATEIDEAIAHNAHRLELDEDLLEDSTEEVALPEIPLEDVLTDDSFFDNSDSPDYDE